MSYESFRQGCRGTKVIPRIKSGKLRMVAESDLDAFMARKEREARARTKAMLGERKTKTEGF